MLMNGLATAGNQGFPLVAPAETRSQGSKTENKPAFKDILNSKFSYEQNQSKNPVTKAALQKPDSTDDKAPDEPVKYKTFRELEKGMRVEAKKAAVKEKTGLSDDTQNGGKGPEDVKSATGDKTEMVLNSLAQIMGIKPDELARLLDSAGIKPEELAAVSKPEAVVSKLSQALGLDSGMQKALEKVLQVINSEVDETISEAPETQTGGETVWTKPEELKAAMPKETETIEAPAASDAEALQGLMLKVKLKLKEMGEKLANRQDEFTDEISAKIQLFLKTDPEMVKLSVKLKEPTVPENPSSDVETGEETVAAVEDNGIAESKPDKPEKKDAAIPQPAAVKTEAQEPAQTFANIIGQIRGKDTDFNPEDIRLRTTIPAREIINQVVEKAKLVITADKSEMVLDLKPDSLGKLSLKVVTENGVIMAKFVAESQQVKQVLETNMQLLKDSLEKQGLNVQGFSVSVRQDSQNGHNQMESRDRSENGRTGSVRPVSGGRIFIDTAGSERLQRMNPYVYEGTTINLTA